MTPIPTIEYATALDQRESPLWRWLLKMVIVWASTEIIRGGRSVWNIVERILSDYDIWQSIQSRSPLIIIVPGFFALAVGLIVLAMLSLSQHNTRRSTWWIAISYLLLMGCLVIYELYRQSSYFKEEGWSRFYLAHILMRPIVETYTLILLVVGYRVRFEPHRLLSRMEKWNPLLLGSYSVLLLITGIQMLYFPDTGQMHSQRLLNIYYLTRATEILTSAGLLVSIWRRWYQATAIWAWIIPGAFIMQCFYLFTMVSIESGGHFTVFSVINFTMLMYFIQYLLLPIITTKLTGMGRRNDPHL